MTIKDGREEGLRCIVRVRSGVFMSMALFSTHLPFLWAHFASAGPASAVNIASVVGF